MVKKAKSKWRAVDTSAIEDAVAEESRRERQGAAVDKVPDADLFYIDTAKDDTAVARSLATRRRKRGPRVLKCQAIINAVAGGKPVNPGQSRARSRGPAVRPKAQPPQQLSRTAEAEEDPAAALDAWREDGEGQKPAKRARRVKSATVQAVEVDAPGCSYNPDYEQHQDAIAEAVATVVTKQLAQELRPKLAPVLTHLPQADELEQLLEDPVSDEEAEAEAGELNQEAGDAGGPAEKAAAKPLPGKKTRADRNREKRRKAGEAALKAKQALKKQRRDLQGLRQLQAALSQQAAEQQALTERKAADRAEAEKGRVPRLGRHKFEPQPMQVLLSDEIDGSLRRLKGTPALAVERFKALQKRGAIEPRGPLQLQKPRRKVVYVEKRTLDETIEQNDAIVEIAKANTRAEAALAAAKQPAARGRAGGGRKRR